MSKSKEQIKNAIKWIDGLISTEVKQGIGALGNDSYGFCCLGFGCNLLGVKYDPTAGNSVEFATEVGLKTVVGTFEKTVINEITVSSLAQLNDLAGYSFKEIAAFIISELGDLFEPEVAKGLFEHYYENVNSKNN